MKVYTIIKGLAICSLLLPALQVKSQKAISFDLAVVRNTKLQLNGLNVSTFYHFTQRLVGGIEMNRYFPVNHTNEDKTIQISAWDFDLNFHYLLPVSSKIKLYPITGISHSSEKEINLKQSEASYDRFWSFNTGAGALFEMGRWIPHAEYLLTWGKMNQQFILVGLSYELEWGRSEKKEKP